MINITQAQFEREFKEMEEEIITIFGIDCAAYDAMQEFDNGDDEGAEEDDGNDSDDEDEDNNEKTRMAMCHSFDPVEFKEELEKIF